MVSIKNITKSFNGNIILDNFSLELPDRGSVCIFGNTGSRKNHFTKYIS